MEQENKEVFKVTQNWPRRRAQVGNGVSHGVGVGNRAAGRNGQPAASRQKQKRHCLRGKQRIQLLQYAIH